MAQLALVLLALFGQMERTYTLERAAHARAVATAKGRRIGLWVPESRRTSCDLLILADEPAEAVVSFDLVDLGCCATGEWS